MSTRPRVQPREFQKQKAESGGRIPSTKPRELSHAGKQAPGSPGCKSEAAGALCGHSPSRSAGSQAKEKTAARVWTAEQPWSPKQ